MALAEIQLWNGDICDLEVDAIVNAATTNLWMSTGVGGALKRRGGDEIEFEAVRQGPVAIGSAVVTGAGSLACQAVIHAVSLDAERRTSAASIDAATRSALRAADALGFERVAFPALGTGVGGFPLDAAAEVTLAAVHDETRTAHSLRLVIFALRGAEAYNSFARAIAREAAAPTAGLA